MSSKRTVPRSQNLLLTFLFLGDCFFCYAGITLGYLLRVKGPLRNIGTEPLGITFEYYQPQIWLGTLVMIASFAYLRLYDSRLLLRPHRVTSKLMKGVFIWFLAFLGFSLAFEIQPAISRMFVGLSCVTTFAVLLFWRFGFYCILSRSDWRNRLQQRVVIVGWSKEAEMLVEAIDKDTNHPYEVVGYISTPNSGNAPRDLIHNRQLGSIDDIEETLENTLVDIVVIAELSLSKDNVMEVASICERLYLQFKIVASFFQIFASSLRMQTISGVPILGIEELALSRTGNLFMKRIADVLGATVGLVGSAPIILILAYLIAKESPGPIIYRQTRVGIGGKPFIIYKLRSMKLNAESKGAQWAVEDDPRRLKIGAMMRAWNLDELPQFWNILKGDMSLVGPRPERPELISQFEREIPHYNPRHEVRPGLTGWAQVNGLRGNTSLVDRVRYDLYYIENWSILFDIQIMILTFIRRQNAY